MASSKNKLKLQFNGFNDMFEKLDKLGADTKKIASDALEESFNAVTPGILAAIKPHKDPGKTEESLVTTPEVVWEGTRAYVEVGFDLDKGGLPSIFLMYGTPKHAVKNQYGATGKSANGITKDEVLFESVYGSSTLSKVRRVQKKVFTAAMKKHLG